MRNIFVNIKIQMIFRLALLSPAFFSIKSAIAIFTCYMYKKLLS